MVAINETLALRIVLWGCGAAEATLIAFIIDTLLQNAIVAPGRVGLITCLALSLAWITGLEIFLRYFDR